MLIDQNTVAGGAAVIHAKGEKHARTWTKWVLLFLVCLWVAHAGISLAIQHTFLRERLTGELDAAFGRPVEVGAYDFSFWRGPALEAKSVSVGEDPRFGHEYFLRAESVTLRFRSLALLRGHLELETLSLTNPSLNIVRNGGDWNLAEWFQPPPGRAGGANRSPLRFEKIEVAGGRINFKQGDEKVPFALVNVAGSVETDSPGRWRLNLDATPMRSAVAVQQAGTLHLSGHVGGTSSRLRPAILDLSWRDASITDVLRLARSYDYGVRGTFALALNAQTEGDAWQLQARAELRQLHRWDLALRSDNPSLNVIAKTKWHPLDSGLELIEAAIETPHSQARVLGTIDWAAPANRRAGGHNATHLQFASAGVNLRDILSWARAFHPGLPDDLSLKGIASGQLSLSGWPPHLDEAGIAIGGAELVSAQLRVPVRLSPVTFRYGRQGIDVETAVISFGDADSSLRIDAPAPPARASSMGAASPAANLRVSGSIHQVRDLIATAGVLGWNLSRGWDLAGPMRCDLRWQGAAYPWQTLPTGSINLGDSGPGGGGASLRAPFLNLPIEQIRAVATLKAGDHHIALTSARAFGAHWSGVFDRLGGDGEWQFALSAGDLSGSDLNRWLNPRWHESFFDRILPFLKAAPEIAAPDNLRANGTLDLDELVFAPFAARRVHADLRIEGRHIEIANGEAQFYGGDLAASLDATLAATPAYNVTLDVSGADLSALSAVSPWLAGHFEGSVSGDISFSASGASRGDLLSSFACQGAVRVGDAEINGMNLAESLRAATPRAGISAFRDASAAFACDHGKVQFHDLLLTGPSARMDGTGSIDFSRNLDLRLRVLPRSAGSIFTNSADQAPSAFYRLTGPAFAPRITKLPPLSEARPADR